MRAGDVEIAGTSGGYSEERLYILETLRRLEKKNDEQIEKAGATREVVGKIQTDLNQAHGRIKTVIGAKDDIEKRVLRVEVKAAYIAAASGSAVAVVVEVAKYLLANHR